MSLVDNVGGQVGHARRKRGKKRVLDCLTDIDAIEDDKSVLDWHPYSNLGI